MVNEQKKGGGLAHTASLKEKEEEEDSGRRKVYFVIITCLTGLRSSEYTLGGWKEKFLPVYFRNTLAGIWGSSRFIETGFRHWLAAFVRFSTV